MNVVFIPMMTVHDKPADENRLMSKQTIFSSMPFVYHSDQQRTAIAKQEVVK